jgi:ubiquinone/menaquinone biosynthesis C-methylase UbiE
MAIISRPDSDEFVSITERASFWDGTSWRDGYYERLLGSSLDRLTPAQRAERDYCLIERQAVKEMIVPAERIADLGCGTGRVTAAAIERYPGKRFFGADLSAAQLEVFRKRLSGPARSRVTLLTGPMSQLLLPDDSLDLALLCNHTFGALLGADREQILTLISRALRQGGKLLIVGFSNLDLARECYRNWGMNLVSIDDDTGLIRLESHYSLWESDVALCEQLRPYGFTVDRHESFDLGYLLSFELTEHRGS